MPERDKENSCDCEPIEVYVVVRGNFEGSKTMDDYYPDLKNTGSYVHPERAGEFDTGSRVGVNVQIVGKVKGNPSKCKLNQELLVERENINGDTSRQGNSYDDIKKSGRDATKSPFKQIFNQKISFADPPSYAYGPGTEIDSKRFFTSCVIACDDKRKCCVRWSLEIKVENGRVTKNQVMEENRWCE